MPILIAQGRPAARRGTAFVVAAGIFGVVAALGITVVLMAIAVPTMTQYLLTAAEKADWERMEKAARLFTSPGLQAVLTGIVLLATIAVVGMLLQVINPRFARSGGEGKGRSWIKTAVVGIAALCCLWAIPAALDSPFSIGTGAGPAVRFLIVILGTSALWLIAGEQGWAGDLSTWGLPRDAQWGRTALLGAAAGTAVYVISSACSWAFGRYFILVSEVLDGSGETSYLGFQQLAAGLVLLLGTALPVGAGFIVALAPVHRDGDGAVRRLVVPVLSLAVVLAVLCGGYWYAGSRYDLDKQSLAGILNVPDKEQASRTVVVFLPAKDRPVTVQDWPLKVTGSSFTGQQTIALSAQNLKKVEDYLGAHRNGTIYQYIGREMLAKGYHSLWDTDKGLDAMQRAADSLLIQRMLLLARLRVLPVTDANLKLLQKYSDEKAWYAGGRSALSLAAGFRHFGKTAEAERWLQKAKAGGADMSKADFMDEPVVVNGAVRGRLLLNGKPLAGVRTALVGVSKDPKALENYSITDLTLSRSLVDVRDTGTDGRFAFASIGSGRYVVAIMLDRDKASFSAVKARNVPGVVQIGPAVLRDLGTIELDMR